MAIEANFQIISSSTVFVIEFGFFVYAVAKTKLKERKALVIALLLLFLSLYQFSEVITCGVNNQQLGIRIGHFAITMLPMLGLYLISAYKIETWYFEYISSVFAAYYGLLFLFFPENVIVLECGSFFVGYRYVGHAQRYGTYYFGTIFVAIVLLILHVFDKINEQGVKSLFSPLDSGLMILLGYLLFVVPTGVEYYVFKMPGKYVSSNMCKWAFLLAIVLFILLKLTIVNKDTEVFSS